MGHFRVTRAQIDDNLAKIIYRDLVPLEVRYGFDFDGQEVLAIGDQFDEVGKGQDAPRYVIEFEGHDEDYSDTWGRGTRRVIERVRFVKMETK